MDEMTRTVIGVKPVELSLFFTHYFSGLFCADFFVIANLFYVTLECFRFIPSKGEPEIRKMCPENVTTLSVRELWSCPLRNILTLKLKAFSFGIHRNSSLGIHTNLIKVAELFFSTLLC